MDFFWMAGVHQQPDQSNYLAEGQRKKEKKKTKLVNLLLHNNPT